MLSFTQVNLHKASQATILLGRDMEEKNQVIAFLTEPYIFKGNITGLPNGTNTVYHKTRSSDNDPPGPRAGIVASKDIDLYSLDSKCSRDCAVAIAKLHGRRVLVVSAYLDITKPAAPDWLQDVVNFAKDRRMPMILAADTNAHSNLYGPDTNARGEIFEDFVLQNSLRIENLGDDPTFEIKRGNTWARSHIDVTITWDLHFDLQNWRVDRSYNASDHNTIRFEAIANVVQKTKIRPW